MGQYYRPLTCDNGEYTVYDRSTKATEDSDPEYMVAKLMEHSYMYNDTLMAFSDKIYQNPMRVAWVGDYADDTGEDEITNPDLDMGTIKELHDVAWKDDDYDAIPMLRVEFDPKDKLLVNWSKKLYMDMNRYLANTNADSNIHPLSLLTAIGNGNGGGDYRGINLKDIGSWAFDRISFEDADKIQSLIDDGFVQTIYEFME